MEKKDLDKYGWSIIYVKERFERIEGGLINSKDGLDRGIQRRLCERELRREKGRNGLNEK